jgi:hypothetical protein
LASRTAPESRTTWHGRHTPGQHQSQIAENVAISHAAFVSVTGVLINTAISSRPRAATTLIHDKIDPVFGAAVGDGNDLRDAGLAAGLRSEADNAELGIAVAKRFRRERPVTPRDRIEPIGLPSLKMLRAPSPAGPRRMMPSPSRWVWSSTCGGVRAGRTIGPDFRTRA